MSASSTNGPGGAETAPGRTTHAPPEPPATEGGAPAPGAPAAPSAPQPLPYDGVVSVAVGTVLWAVASLVLLFFVDDLRSDGRLWWLATAICGFVLGLAGLWVVVRRRNRLRAQNQPTTD